MHSTYQPELFKGEGAVQREVHWLAACMLVLCRWPGQRRPAWCSLMRLMPLVGARFDDGAGEASDPFPHSHSALGINSLC